MATWSLESSVSGERAALPVRARLARPGPAGPPAPARCALRWSGRSSHPGRGSTRDHLPVNTRTMGSRCSTCTQHAVHAMVHVRPGPPPEWRSAGPPNRDRSTSLTGVPTRPCPGPAPSDARPVHPGNGLCPGSAHGDIHVGDRRGARCVPRTRQGVPPRTTATAVRPRCGSDFFGFWLMRRGAA